VSIEGPLIYETANKNFIGKLPFECYDTIDGKKTQLTLPLRIRILID
jgi:hypothetical protein